MHIYVCYTADYIMLISSMQCWLYRFPDYSGAFTNCGVADPGTCSTTLDNVSMLARLIISIKKYPNEVCDVQTLLTFICFLTTWYFTHINVYL